MSMKALTRLLLLTLVACTLLITPVSGLASAFVDGDSVGDDSLDSDSYVADSLDGGSTGGLFAVESRSAASEKAKDKQLRPSGRGSYVKWYQARLKKLGYYKGRLVKVYNRSTYEATKLFQTYNGLTVNGIGGKATRGLLFSKEAVSRKSYDDAHFLSELRKKSKGAQVTQFQQRLIDYGYLSGTPSGVYDDDTVAACKYFQDANGLKINGVASRETRSLINEGAKVMDYGYYLAASQSSAVKKGDWGLDVYLATQRLKELGYYTGKLGHTFTSAMQKSAKKFEEFNGVKKPDGALSKAERELLHDSDALAYADVCGPDTLKPGMSGKAVLRVQVILKQLKFYKGKLNSKYTSQLTSGVKKFQKKYGQVQSGICYSPTIKLIHAKNPMPNVPNARASAVIAFGLEQLGKPYKTPADGPSSFDCSGFTRYVFSKGTDGKISLPHNARQQSSGKVRVLIDDDLLPGDLVFFATGTNKKKINHVGLVIESDGKGNVRFVHASSIGKKVMISSFKDASSGNFYQKRFIFGRRVW